MAAGPGGGDDFVARMVATKLGESFGQQFIVDNRPGAGGFIGQSLVAKSPPDGYTLLLAGGSMAGARFATMARFRNEHEGASWTLLYSRAGAIHR